MHQILLERLFFVLFKWFRSKWPLNFNSHEWPRQNFSSQNQYNINQISDENIEKYQFGDNELIQY